MTAGDRLPAAPRDLVAKGRGRRFWRSVLADHELRADELELLAESARMMDLLDALRALCSPLVIDGRTNPALVESRLVRLELRRSLAQLCLPDVEEEGHDAWEVPATEVSSIRSARARRAARARWDAPGAG